MRACLGVSRCARLGKVTSQASLKENVQRVKAIFLFDARGLRIFVYLSCIYFFSGWGGCCGWAGGGGGVKLVLKKSEMDFSSLEASVLSEFNSHPLQ